MAEHVPPCIDCGKPLGPVRTEAFSSCYLCDFCRTHRYKSERGAMARVNAWKWKYSHREATNG